MKYNGKKSYHPYLSHDKLHDHCFVRKALKELLREINVNAGTTIIIERDNCASQYRSCAHFNDIQQLSDEYNTVIIRVFGILEHGKGETDREGGIAKTAIRRETGVGQFFADAGDMVEFLQEQFCSNKNPVYIIKEIEEKDLLVIRKASKFERYKTINGFSLFQVVAFKSNKKTVFAAKRLCIRNICRCDLFEAFEIDIEDLTEISFGSTTLEYQVHSAKMYGVP